MPRSLIFKFMFGITIIVITVLVGTLLWDVQYAQDQVDKGLLLKADLVSTHLKATRSYVAQSQGTVHGDPTTPVTPSEIGKGVDQLFADLGNFRVKQTRLVVRDGNNQPDEFEQEALLTFADYPDRTIVYGRATDPDGRPVFRYLTSLRAEKSCLVCHGDPVGELDKTGHPKEGMKEGDLAGAISVTLPMSDLLRSARTDTLRAGLAIVLVAVLILALIWFIVMRQVSLPLQQLAGVAESIGQGHIRVDPNSIRPLLANRETAVVAEAFQSMAARLEELYSGLEQKVIDRTAQLQAANVELERASHMKSEFLTMISHEFRTPLTSIITFTELLLDSAAGQVNQEQQEYLTDVLESSHRLLQMITDLLDLSRLEAGKTKLFREALSIRDLVRNAERTVRPLAERKEQSLTFDLKEDLPLVDADGLRVTQVLLNLLGNAIKFTPEQGRITITAHVQAPFLEVAVSDTGIGIGPGDQERIFEKFSQSGRERPEGTGLGLPLARSLVELHGGNMWVESELGRGSTFRFTLPLCSEEGRLAHDERTETNSGG
jgi:signal transduction histidine kinase